MNADRAAFLAGLAERAMPRRVVQDLGVQINGAISWDQALEICAELYWDNRPAITEKCGSEPGYRAHLIRKQTPCQPCRDAAAMVKAINRLRRSRGVTVPRPELLPCGTHAAFNRHKKHDEDPCAPCFRGESAYQATRHETRKVA